ncbi:murein transglycosylase [Mangrovibacter yixingensis]|uniref:murein transglycosylase n=1 Tax=Mangrovibacter yixingensis TaxID=1529639 RepID=UPI001CFE381E|nr:murein transglycosylase [Mangrovibacter yixingensis]
MGKAKQSTWRFAAASLCLLTASHAVWADSLDEQRQRYSAIKQAWDKQQMDVVQQMMPGLKDYPLYPYLEYRELTSDLQNETAVAVTQFVHQYPTMPISRTLTTRFINELARRSDWKGLLAFSPTEPSTTEAKCNYYNAKWQTGQTSAAWVGAHKLWQTGRTLPLACENLFTAWLASGQQSADDYLSRIVLAMKSGNTSLVNSLAGQLPDNDLTLSSSVISLADDPQTVLSFSRTVKPSDFTRRLVELAFASVARQDVENARAMIPALVQSAGLDDSQAQSLKDIVAWRLFGNDVTDEQARWRDDIIMRSGSDSLIERRIRMALGEGDRAGLNTWLSRLSMEAKQEDEWRYWQADLLLERGREAEGRDILRDLMKSRGFYPMVAAQRLGVPYQLTINDAPEASGALVRGPELARIRELMYWNLDNTARGEWASYIASRPPEEQAALAHYALKQGWWDLSVQATIAGKLWDNLTERFPPAWKATFDRYVSSKDISRTYAMAIARQESAWNPKVRSPVGATGLMQLMPATATHTVKMFNIPGYTSSNQLLDPDTNINIGTQYLQYVYQQFGDNRIYASAAYNAGPGRVRSWQGNSSGRIDAVAFIESIPFSETRRYVKNVLAYDAYYRYFDGDHSPLLTQQEWQQRY